MPHSAAQINLAGTWQLQGAPLPAPIDIEIPGDVYSALIKAQIAPHPYWGRNELAWLKFAKECWTIRRSFELSQELASNSLAYLSIYAIDTCAALLINGQPVHENRSMFIPLLCNVAPYLRRGANQLEVQFESAELYAAARAARHPYPVPTSQFPVQSSHRNFVRKVQCHAGWDWGPALMTAGLYGQVVIDFNRALAIEQCSALPTLRGSQGEVQLMLQLFCQQPGSYSLQLRLGERQQQRTLQLEAGRHTLQESISIDNPQLWWPAGYGSQPRYQLTCEIAGNLRSWPLAFRHLKLESREDRYGSLFQPIINGMAILSRGANWIPTDALPAAQSAARSYHLLDSAVAANMNMLRVWGGGQYEPNWFYEYCDSIGLMIWQDCMFSCSLYPADSSFLSLVQQEVECQLLRLRHHPSIVLWCGNNENVGALGWYEESQRARDRYIVDYDRLNEGVIGTTVRRVDPSRPFWPSSPCNGIDDYSDNWHDDSRGDMHYWSVWHEGKSFEAYREVIPRFCSEFGFQSLPSLKSIASYADPHDWNPTSPVMEHHQRHPRGNSIILETISRYFRFPKDLPNIIYLSQLQQALAIQWAVEYWRAHRERCAGMLYWQLNEVWPGASWSSIEHNGDWKLLHYAARRFYAPLHIAGYVEEAPRGADRQQHIILYSELLEETECQVELRWYSAAGRLLEKRDFSRRLQPRTAVEVEELAPAQLRDLQPILFMHLWSLQRPQLCAKNILLYEAPKRYALAKVNIEVALATMTGKAEGASGISIRLSATQPALYVALAYQKSWSGFSDNLLHLLPGEERQINYPMPPEHLVTPEQFRSELEIFDLASSGL